MMCVGARALFYASLSHSFSSSKHLRRCLSSSSNNMSSSPTHSIEHIVLFKVKHDTDPSQVNAMVNGLGGLVSLDPVQHLTVGPVHRNRSSAFTFTHLLHSRYNSKDDLNAYSAHPAHVSVVKASVRPICDDLMAVDWVSDGVGTHLLTPGTAVRVTFLKLKEDVTDEVKDSILGVIRGIKDKFEGVTGISCGENFSPARAKGFSIASLAVFQGISEMEAVDSNEELVNLQKEKVREHLDGLVVVDYVVPSPQAQSASL